MGLGQRGSLRAGHGVIGCLICFLTSGVYELVRELVYALIFRAIIALSAGKPALRSVSFFLSMVGTSRLQWWQVLTLLPTDALTPSAPFQDLTVT